MGPLKPGTLRHRLYSLGSKGGTLEARRGSRLALLRSGSPVMLSASALANALGNDAPDDLDTSEFWLLRGDDKLTPVEPVSA